MSSEVAKFFPVSEQQYEGILKEFEKTKEDVDNDVKIIREWLKKQPHIPEIADDSFIAKVLVRNKCRVEKTKTKIDSYFTSKSVYADFYAKCDPCAEEVVNCTKYVFNAMLPKLTPNNRRVIYWTVRLPKGADYTGASIILYSALNAETQFLNDDCPNVISIFDSKGFGIAQALNVDLNMQAKMMKIFFEAFSGRVEAMHNVNISPGAEKAMNLVKPFFPAKLRDRIYFHSNFESLHKIIPKDCLPSEVGGTGPSGIELAKQMAEATRNDRDGIMERHKIATNEVLRVGDPPIELDMFGVDGTFKKITLD